VKATTIGIYTLADYSIWLKDRHHLSDVRVIMAIIRVLVVESVCQAATGWIQALECVLLGSSGSQRLCLTLTGIKWPCRLRSLALGSLVRYLRPPDMATGVLSVY
jgi:hypothetical protein